MMENPSQPNQNPLWRKKYWWSVHCSALAIRYCFILAGGQAGSSDAGLYSALAVGRARSSDVKSFQVAHIPWTGYGIALHVLQPISSSIQDLGDLVWTLPIGL